MAIKHKVLLGIPLPAIPLVGLACLIALIVAFAVAGTDDDQQQQTSGGGGGGRDGCQKAAGGTAKHIDPAAITVQQVEGDLYTWRRNSNPLDDQLLNAAYIMQAAADLGLSNRDTTIGVMTAMLESSLRVIDYGDQAGPDSRGLYQQRANGAWGSYEDRMNPYISSTNFFKALQRAFPNGTSNYTPTQVAHQVQRNADPNAYSRFWGDAVKVVAALGGFTSSNTCQTAAGEWVYPLPQHYRVTSGFGPRPAQQAPNGQQISTSHSGVDLGAPCNTPILAAAAGTVTFAGWFGAGGNTIKIDNGTDPSGKAITTYYEHQPDGGFLVSTGQTVQAGQQIGRVGTTGTSTGCHLHFGVSQAGTMIDPVPFMAARGVTI